MDGTEISDTERAVILNSGPDSSSTEMKDVNTHTRAMKLKLEVLEDRLKTCLLELKRLCIREAELTGCLSSDCPLLPGEKPPQIRRRVGAAFKLDEPSILQRSEDSELSSVEVALALQQQIYVAAHRLCQEKHLSRAVKRSRLQQLQREERKLKDLQETMFRLQLDRSRSSPRRSLTAQSEDLMSQSSQLSSEPPVPAVDHHPTPLSQSHPPPYTPTGPSYQPPENALYQTPPQSLEDLHLWQSPALDHDSAPIQNSPWMESSLDQPYQKKSHSSRTRSSCSPAVTPTSPPLKVCLAEFVLPTRAALHHMQSCSAPSTPDTHLRRRQSLRVSDTDPPYGCSRGPGRHVTELALTSQDYPPMRLYVGNLMYNSSSEDSSSEHSVQSYASSSCQENPGELMWPYQNQPGYQYDSLADSHVRQRCSPANFYNSDQQWSSPSLSRGYVENGSGCLLDFDTVRSYISHQVPSPVNFNHHYGYSYNEALTLQQRGYRVLPAHMRDPQHPSRGQLLSEELKSWHHRSQCRAPLLCSIDQNRQTTLHFQKPPGQESPLSRPRLHRFQEQQVNDCYAQTSVINRQKMY